VTTKRKGFSYRAMQRVLADVQPAVSRPDQDVPDSIVDELDADRSIWPRGDDSTDNESSTR
jgi:hypothetical protein